MNSIRKEASLIRRSDRIHPPNPVYPVGRFAAIGISDYKIEARIFRPDGPEGQDAGDGQPVN
jgi:hypothetical protein